ncbi:MAG: molybdopterin molybdotransferase MoeA [Maribacter sp.]
MITFKEAYQKVLEHTLDLGDEKVPLLESMHCVLAEDITADRDFPPFDRATKDGIAISFSNLANQNHEFTLEGDAAAGMPQQTLKNANNCLEVMTGAVVPKNTDTVVMYEHITISNGKAIINENVVKGQNIHYQGSDEKQGVTILKKGVVISPAEIGVMASVGKDFVKVKTFPKVCTISTGDELVDVDSTPEPHQIRKSNTFSLQAALSQLTIYAETIHLLDDKQRIEEGLKNALRENDVLLLSGGVSKGKFDFIPEVMEDLGVEKIFHRVAQRPGKPFWFGIQRELKTVIFSFPGNPVSTFANYHLYFLPWLHTSWDILVVQNFAKLAVELEIKSPLTRFIQVKIDRREATLWARPVTENGSGDLTSLAKADGFICLEPREEVYRVGELVLFVGTR